jgi:hypothetical protein
MTVNTRTKLTIGFLVFLFTYLSTWLSFWAIAAYERGAETLALPYKLALGLVGALGYTVFVVSIPVQLLAQRVLEFFGIVQHETFGVTTYPTWVTFFIAAATATAIAAIFLVFLPRNKST